MSLAQKFCGFISSKATVATLAGVLAVLPLFNGNAQAQEPMRTSHNPQSSSAPQHLRPTPLHDAMAYSKIHKGIGIMIAVGKEDINRVSGEQLGEMIRNYFKSEGIDSEVFTSLSSGKYTAIAYTVKGMPVSDEAAGLNEAKAMAVVALSQYDDAYGTHLSRKPLSAGIANSRE